MPVKRFNHAFDFAFEVISDDEDAKDVTPAMLRSALLKRAIEIDDFEIVDACNRFDTMDADA